MMIPRQEPRDPQAGLKGMLLQASRVCDKARRPLDQLEAESWWNPNLTETDRRIALAISFVWIGGLSYIVFSTPGLPVRLMVEMFLLGLGTLGLSLATHRVLAIRRILKAKEGKEQQS
jgi:peptidoglycan/LPS O-acetylase OafA/YrhL